MLETAIANTTRVEITASSATLGTPCGNVSVGRREDSGSRSANGSLSDVLVRGAHPAGSHLALAAGDCLILPRPIDAALALMVPPLAWALAQWETLALELGDAAVVTGSGRLCNLVAQAALWRGGCPVVQVNTGAGREGKSISPNVIEIDGADAESAAAEFVRATVDRPGLAAVEMTGRPDIIDLLLEAMPLWSRVMLAGPGDEPATIDFYKNVHKKGAVIAATTAEPVILFSPRSGQQARDQIRRAVEILVNPRTAAVCHQILEAIPSGQVAPV